jgi:hypothetical protein
MFRKAFKGVLHQLLVVCLDPFSPTPSTSSAMKAPENAEEKPDDPEPAEEGDIQMEYSSDYLYSLSIGAVTSNYI